MDAGACAMKLLQFVFGIFLCLDCLAVFAEVRFTSPRSFVLDQPCKAYSSLKKKTGAEPLVAGTTYQGISENKASGASHVLLRLGEGDLKWVALTCGHYADHSDGHATVVVTPPAAQCLPFFDDEDNPVKVGVGGMADITPPAPQLNAFDLAVNATCGTPGKPASPAEFQQLMQNHPDVLQRIRSFTDNRVYANRPEPVSDEAFLHDLTDAWSTLDAFSHIFCGQPGEGGRIGGLHFYGRYAELQASATACRMSNYRQNEVVPGVLYTMGVAMQGADGKIYRHSTKGYGLTLDAEDILKTATRAFAQNPAPGNVSTACLLPVSDDGKQFTVVFVRRARGIRTFYPDATPDPREPACAAPVHLQ